VLFLFVLQKKQPKQNKRHHRKIDIYQGGDLVEGHIVQKG